jgi:proliferating cell nuclear antigen
MDTIATKPDNPDYILELNTFEADVLKILSEALKDLLDDINIEFDENGIRILFLDTFTIILVYVKLMASNFSHYYCKDKIVVGVNMDTLSMILSTITKDNTLSMYINSKDRDNLGIIITDSKRTVRYHSKMPLLDLDSKSFTMPGSEFDVSFNMPSDLFKKIVTDINKFAKVIEIKSMGSQLIFTGVSDKLTKSIIVGESEGNLEMDDKSDDQIIQGYYKLDKLCMFTKCSNLSETVKIFLCNDFPIVIQYDVGGLGEIRLMLVPTTNPFEG